MSVNSRLIASQVIDEVTEGRSLSDALSSHLLSVPSARDRAFIQAMCYGVCRYYTRLDVILSHLLSKPMKAKDADVHALLLVGLYQLTEMRVPEHAAVAETVNATGSLDKTWSRGFVNAILREYLREREQLNARVKVDEEALYAHPQWWINAIKKAWPKEWEEILAANNNHPPFTLRVNPKHATRDAYLQQLAEADLAAHALPQTLNGFVLDVPVSIEEVPGFSEGKVSVQDGAAQLAGHLLEFAPEQRFLDACAAPGGKLVQILESEPTLTAIAVEKDRVRLKLIKENLDRSEVNAECICADVGDTEAWWDGALFDRILLDAPCSASGVIRRHPDIKILRQPSDIEQEAKEQTRLLNSLWPLLKPGGLLLYATCSIFPAENVDVVKQFLATHNDAQEQVIEADWGIKCEIGRQILPGMHEMDGFYYARLAKNLV